jgi:hypothetical protein
VTGREAQARKDAMADAETLWRFLTSDEWWTPRRRPWNLIDAEDFGYQTRSEIDRENVKASRLYATEAARAAFRAVPGLRGK